jgi:hypothetical protein
MLGQIAVFYWPHMRPKVCRFVRGCQECQRAKHAQDSRVGLHSSEVVTRPLERVFIDFVGLIVRRWRGNVTVLVVLDGFSKFVFTYPVRRISSEVVKNCLLEKFFPIFGVPPLLLWIRRQSSSRGSSIICSSPGAFPIALLHHTTPKRLNLSSLTEI